MDEQFFKQEKKRIHRTNSSMIPSKMTSWNKMNQFPVEANKSSSTEEAVRGSLWQEVYTKRIALTSEDICTKKVPKKKVNVAVNFQSLDFRCTKNRERRKFGELFWEGTCLFRPFLRRFLLFSARSLFWHEIAILGRHNCYLRTIKTKQYQTQNSCRYIKQYHK